VRRWAWIAALLVFNLAAVEAFCQQVRRTGMRGPDFDFGHVVEWQPGGARATLKLDDASSWSIEQSAPMYASIDTTVGLARRLGSPLFVAGDRKAGRLERVALPEKLRPAHVAKETVDGKVAVVFHGPPTPAFLAVDRPWFAAARDRLLASLARETSAGMAPPCLVTIDVVSREIMDVRAP
jgi:hypothetical protein